MKRIWRNRKWRSRNKINGFWERNNGTRGNGKRAGKVILAVVLSLVLGKAWMMAADQGLPGQDFWRERETAFFSYLWNCLYPAPIWEGREGDARYGEIGKIADRMEQVRKLTQAEDDPAYRSAKAAEAFFQEHAYLEIYGNEETGELPGENTDIEWEMAKGSYLPGEKNSGSQAEENENTRIQAAEDINNEETAGGDISLAATGAAYPGRLFSLAQLEDYDFLMKHFYNVHTSTTAERELMDAKKMLSHDFRLKTAEEVVDTENTGAEQAGVETAAKVSAGEPQILIYHTHSQEAFIDSQPEETIVAVGNYLTQCLTEKGFHIYHDTSTYDVRSGKLDRNKAYSYALEGVTEILEKNPSIQVVIDLHRDGVGQNTHLATEINGKPTARIMFFNGMSQTPEGAIPYLENPYREDNLAFSFQLQLKAAAWYPGFTRKIYLKGLRYNQHLRPRSCLIEVGAQTNTYQEALNAMEPLADILDMVLSGK